jgi:uncharacterized membrane protein YdjX (TVP38/TMEM64 family)
MREKRDDAQVPASRPMVWVAWSILVALIIAVGWSWYSGGIIGQLLSGDLSAAEKIARLREFFAAFGPFAPAVYFLFVVAEVVIAPIPGLMLYAPGGIIFGGLLGGALSLAGNVVGAGIACTIARTIRPAWIDKWFATEKVSSIQFKLDRFGGWLIFLLRLNPLTSSDVISYAAGFTRIPVRTVMLATCAGMAPLCFAQAWLAENLIDAFPGLVYLLLVACAVYVVLLLLVLRRMMLAPEVGTSIDESTASEPS